jgi:hypothetical protein
MRAGLAGPLTWAAVATCAALGWQALTVHYNYGGDWSALFYTGQTTAVPPDIAQEDVYRVNDATGYDGQYYHMIAHDPLLRHGTESFLDNPRLRWRRILVPALAYMAAGGESDRVDSAYGAVVLGFVFLGTLWLARWAVASGRHPAWGLIFLAFPAVAVSFDRYTIDVALAALAIGLVVEGGTWLSLPVLILAPLARETGVVLVAAYALDAALGRRWRRVAIAAASALPWAVWLLYASRRTAPDRTVFASWVPFYGLTARTVHPIQDSVATPWLLKAAILEYVAILGVWVAVALAAALLWKGRRDLVVLAAGLFAVVFVAFLGQPQAWSGVYSFGRTMSPLLIWLVMAGLAARRWLFLTPLAMAIPRILFQLAPQWRGIWHGLFR